MTTEALRIDLHGLPVGILEYFPADEDYVFSFVPSYLAQPRREVLGQIFEDFRPRSIMTSGMPAWFANLLPQGRLRLLLANAVGVAMDDNFNLLRAIGTDLPGAVTATQSESRLPAQADHERRAEQVPEAPTGLKFSLAGVQLKLSIVEGERGLTVPVRGQNGRLIAKFDDPLYPNLPAVEYATLTWAARVGLRTPQFRLTTTEEFIDLDPDFSGGNGTVFLIKRFDRTGPSLVDRVHIEDFAQILDRPPGPPQYHGSVEQVAGVLRYLAPADMEEFVRRVVFCVIAGNGDAHLKNWSVVYPGGGRAELSPLYDLVSTIVYLPRDDMALSLGGTKNFAEVTAEHFYPVGEAAGIDRSTIAGWVQDTCESALCVWSQGNEVLAFSADQRTRIERHLAQLPLLRV
jgi:serine/threonine-protein kinase HipA